MHHWYPFSLACIILYIRRGLICWEGKHYSIQIFFLFHTESYFMQNTIRSWGEKKIGKYLPSRCWVLRLHSFSETTTTTGICLIKWELEVSHRVCCSNYLVILAQFVSRIKWWLWLTRLLDWLNTKGLFWRDINKIQDNIYKGKTKQNTTREINECIQMWVCFNQIFETFMFSCFVEHFQALGLLPLGQT